MTPAKYLNSPKTPLFLKNKTLYGLNIARRAIGSQDRLLVVEGYMDVIAAQEAGFENTVATMGTALTDEHVSIIARFTKNVTLAFDADSAGMAAALRSSPIFERAGFEVRIMSMPKGEDPDSLLREGDRTRFAELVAGAMPTPDFRIKLALSKHDIRSDEGKAAALREASAILADIDSVVERERLIRLLAKYHPNFSTGTTLAEDHLRTEVSRFRNRVGGQRYPVGPTAETGALSVKPEILTLVERSQKLLLGIIIFRNADASKVFASVPPKEFTREDMRTLAEAVNKQYAEQGKIDRERLRSEVVDTPAEKLMTDLMMGLGESELSQSADELVRVIIDHKKNEQRQRMRALAPKISEGLIKKGDEEFEEYWRLVREKSNPWRR